VIDADNIGSMYTRRLAVTEQSFLSGVASVIDLGGGLTRYDVNSDVDAADLRALRADSMAVLADAEHAIRKVLAERERLAKGR
jgi:hypothetical protein